MRNLGRVCVQIPARAGSKRVRAKNLRYINGRPLITYAIESALNADIFDEIYVNTDSIELAELATQCGVLVHHRNPDYATDDASGDDFNYEFIDALKPDTVVMVSPVCPLVTSDDIKEAVALFKQSECDTLISCDKTQMQTFCREEAVNIDTDMPLARTQDNPEVKTLNWAITIWDAASFMRNYEKNKSGYLGVNRLLMPIDASHSIKISYEEDFKMAELLLKARYLSEPQSEPRYWSTDDPLDLAQVLRS